jgi:PEGA domain
MPRRRLTSSSTLITLAISVSLGFLPLLLLGADKKKQAEPFALLMGTCFNEQGFSLPGAKVMVELASEPAVKVKKKKWDMVSSPRGEFAVRLPAGQHTFRVAVSKEGFKPAEKKVSFESDERQDIMFSLEPEPKKR